MCTLKSKSVKRLQRYGEFDGFQNGSSLPSWICEIQIQFFLTVGAVKELILHQHTKYRKDRSNRCGDIAIFVIFEIFKNSKF